MGPWNLEPGTWNLEPGPWTLEPGTWTLEPGTWTLEPGTWNLEPGTWNLEPGTWNLEPMCELAPEPGPTQLGTKTSPNHWVNSFFLAHSLEFLGFQNAANLS